MDDGVLHVRGAVYLYDVVGDEHSAGGLRVVVSLNLDFADRPVPCGARERWTSTPSTAGTRTPGTAHWTTSNPLAPDARDIWAGRVVRRGFGELEAWQARGTILERTHVLTLEEDYAFRPSRWPAPRIDAVTAVTNR